ncbi:glycosyltransferase family 39 protein [Iamia sp.]|uniref:glycosyltransferase family 39 protein n=1 Tax=Iamia sp. TaxID=2722710 RepID=UPI002B826C25|nr:glycosyltransferase family 39 protein [Iamia sp.]HXH56655.1 glycosyltransferase family 39 protein [Iamia sp.]
MHRPTDGEVTAPKAAAAPSGGAPWRRERIAPVTWLSALAAAVLTMVATARGPGLTPDSMNYLSAGLNLAEGHGLRTFRGMALTVFPPGLPTVVAVGQWLGVSVEWTVRTFNAGAAAASVVLGARLLRNHVRTPVLVSVATVLLAISPPLLAVGRMAWTEPAFIVASLALVLVLERLATTHRRVAWLVVAGTLVALAFLFRYAGIVLIPTGALAILLGRWRHGWRDAVTSASAFSALSAVVPVAWALRNRGVDGTAMGFRPPSTDGPATVGERFASTLGEWALPSPAPAWLQGATVVAALLLLSAGLLLGARAGVALRQRLQVPAAVRLVPLLLFVGAYATYLALAQLATALNPIGTRLMSPLWVPLVVLGTVGLERLPLCVPEPRRRLARSVGAGLLVLFVLGQGVAAARDVRAAAVNGVGYAVPSRLSPDLAAAVRDLPGEAILYTNDPNGLWAASQRQPLRSSPAKGDYRTGEARALPARFLRLTACNDSYLAWSDRETHDYFFTPDELEEHVQLTVAAAEADGTLYRISPLAPVAGGREQC